MQKKFLKNIILLLTLNLLIKPFWILGIDVAVQNRVGAAEYGWYFAIFNFSFLLNILLDFGITNFNNKNIAQNNHLLRKHLSSIVLLKLLLGVLYLVITLIGGFFINYSHNQLMLLIVMAFNQFLISFVLYLRSNLSGLHLFKLDSFMSILDRLIMIGICAILLWGSTGIEFSIRWFVFAQTLAYLLTALIALIVVFHRAKARFLKLRWNLPFSIMIIKNSFPFAILVLMMTFYNRIDTVMMERILPDPDGSYQSGIYASAYRLLDATNMIAFLFSALLLPMFSRMIKHKENIEKLVKLSFTMLLVPAFIISIGSYFYATDIMKLMYKSHVEESAEVFKRLMFCFIPISCTYIFGTLLTANGNLKQLNFVAASGMTLNITLNFILIPEFMSKGSAFASLCTQTITALIQIYLAIRFFKMRPDYSFIIRFALYLVGVIIAGYVSTLLPFGWFIRLGIMACAAGLWAFAVRIISFRAFFNIMKYG
ncbi:MAG: oligosaccharide flippase family protein [Bacteroidota bacterium]